MVKKIQGYETDDGETFTSREDAERHEAVIAVRAWLGADQPVDADSLVALIESDPEGARRVLAPLMPVRRPREARGKAKSRGGAPKAVEPVAA